MARVGNLWYFAFKTNRRKLSERVELAGCLFLSRMDEWVAGFSIESLAEMMFDTRKGTRLS